MAILNGVSRNPTAKVHKAYGILGLETIGGLELTSSIEGKL